MNDTFMREVTSEEGRGMQYLVYTYTKKLCGVHLKFKLNWVSCILYGNLSQGGDI